MRRRLDGQDLRGDLVAALRGRYASGLEFGQSARYVQMLWGDLADRLAAGERVVVPGWRLHVMEDSRHDPWALYAIEIEGSVHSVGVLADA